MAKRKVFHSFAELGKSMGIVKKPKSASAPWKCRRCGGDMTAIEGTNVVICRNNNDKGEMCGNRIILRAR